MTFSLGHISVLVLHTTVNTLRSIIIIIIHNKKIIIIIIIIILSKLSLEVHLRFWSSRLEYSRLSNGFHFVACLFAFKKDAQTLLPLRKMPPPCELL